MIGSKRGLGRELLLLMLPLLAVGAVALSFWWRAATGPQLLATPTPVTKVFPLPDGRVFALGSAATQGNVNVPTRIYIWKSARGPLIVNRSHTVNTRRSAVSPDGRLWAYSVASSATGQITGSEVRDLRDFSLVCGAPLSMTPSQDQWQGARELEMYNSITKKFGIYRVDEKSKTLKFLAAKKKDAGNAPDAPDNSWRVRYQSQKPIEFQFFQAGHANESKETLYSNALIFESQLKPPKPPQRIVGPLEARRWTSDSRTFMAVVHLGPFDFTRDDIVRFDAQSGQFSSVRLENTRFNNWYSSEFSSDGKFLVSSSEGGQIWQIWDARSGRLLRDIGQAVDKPDFIADDQPRLTSDGKFWLRPTKKGVEVWDLNAPK